MADTPVVLIEGEAGTGKTTLALQIAHAALDDDPGRFAVFFYRLEQPSSSLRRLAKAFDFAGGKDSLWDFRAEAWPVAGQGVSSVVHLCHVSPLPIRDVDAKPILEARFAEIHHLLSLVVNHAGHRTPV